MTRPDDAVQLGIDVGSAIFRAAYVYPDEERTVVPVPITLKDFRPCFPIIERQPTNDAYRPRFFPGFVQRLDPTFELTLSGRIQTAREVLTDLFAQTVAATRNFAARSIDTLVVAVPAWLPLTARALVRDALQPLPISRSTVRNDADVVAAYMRAQVLGKDRKSTALFFSAGYTGLSAALLRMTPGADRVLAMGGEQGVLAGNCLDYAILQSTLQELREHRIPISDLRQYQVWSEFQHRVEIAKHKIGAEPDASFTIPEPILADARKAVPAQIDTARFGELVSEHVTHAMRAVHDMLSEGGIENSDISHILLHGGTVQYPAVRRALESTFPKAEIRYLPPEALAAGAALLDTDARVESIDSHANASSDFFYPDSPAIPGLVSVELGEATASAPPSHAPPESVDHVTIALLRTRAEAGDREGARRQLERLREEISKELERLTPPGSKA